MHINVLEMTTAYFAVKIYAATLTEISMNLRVDNTAILAWIKEFAKLRVFRAYVLCVPTCLRAMQAYFSLNFTYLGAFLP